MEVCPSCRASNRPDALWCGRCLTRFAETEPRPPQQIAPMKPVIRSAPRARPRTGAIVVASFLIAWSVVQVLNLGRGGSAVAGSLDPRGFRFMAVEEGTGEPVRYDACSPIHYVINPRFAPPSAIDDVKTALSRTSDATGLTFIYDGTTDEIPSANRVSYQPDRYGERWAPVLIGWAAGLSSDGAANSAGTRVVGRAGSTYRMNDQGKPVYVTGSAVFDGTAELSPGFGGETWGQAMLHEFAHVVGLDHVDDSSSVMNPVMGLRPAAWGPKDKEGLWELGLGSPCLTAPSPT